MRSIVPHSGSQLQVLDRAAELLALLEFSREPLGLAALAARSGLSKTTTRRVLVALEFHRFVERTPAGAYRLGLRLFELGSLVQRQLDLRERSAPKLHELAERTRLTVFLCIRDSDRAICIERIDGAYAHSLALRLGGSLPLHVGAGPVTLLAHAPREEVETYIRAALPLTHFTRRTHTTPEEILAVLSEVRERGYVVSDQDVTEGVAAIGAPVFDHAGMPVAAVSVSGLLHQVLGKHTEDMARLVCETGLAISRELGFREHPRAEQQMSRTPGSGPSLTGAA